MSPSCSTRSRHAIVRPTVKPPPIPAYVVEQSKETPQCQIQPGAVPQKQYSPQAYTAPTLSTLKLSEQRRNQAPPPPSEPPPLPSLENKSHSQPLLEPKARPDPPKRPPPPCPVNKPSVVNMFCICLKVKPWAHFH